MKVFLNSKFQIEKVEDKLEDALVKGSTRFDLLTVYIPIELKESFSSIAPMYSVKRADGLKLGPYGTLANEELFEQDLSVDGYYGWAGYFNARDLSVKGALEITFAFVINDSTIKTVASVATNVINAVEINDDIFVIGDNQIVTSLVESVKNLLVNSLTMANDVVQNYAALTSYSTVDLPCGFRILVMNDSNNDNNPTLYQWNGTAWENKGYFDWTGYLDTKFNGYKETLDEYIDGKFDTQDEHIDERLDLQDAQIQSLGQLQPSGVDTSANILAKTSADGIWVGSDTGKWYYWDGTQYVVGGDYVSNFIPETKLLVSSTYLPDTITDLNDTNLINKTYFLAHATSQSDLANAPFYPFQGIITTFGTGDNDIVFQFVFSPYNMKMYYRMKWGVWQSWYSVEDKETISLLKDKIIINNGNGEGSITDLNDQSLSNKVYYIAHNLTENDILNAPFYPFQGMIVTQNSDSDIVSQFVYDPFGNIYFRSKWGVWQSWKKLNNQNTPLDISFFEKIGVIGDSYASGELYNSSGTQLGDFYNISWLQIMARKNGFTGYNFSVGGETTTDFLTNVDHGLPKLKTTDKCGLYLLALGINDSNYTTLGSIDDIHDSDPSLNPNTFYGNYGKIIEEIKTYSPNSKFIFITMGYGAKTDPYNQAIRTMANHYGIPYIETMDNEYFASSWYTSNMYSNHPTTPVYAMMSKQYQKMIEDCIYNNVDYFKDYTGQNLN